MRKGTSGPDRPFFGTRAGITVTVFLLAGRIERLLGDTGRIILTRLLGVILAALAVQFIADGVTQLVVAANQAAG